MTNSNVIGKAYASKSNARRAAKGAFGNNFESQVEIQEKDGKFVIAAIETEVVTKFNKRTGDVRAVPTPKQPKGTPRQKGAVAELWELFDELNNEGLRRVDILDRCVQEGYNYWTVRTQLQLFMKALKGETTSAKKDSK